MQKDISGAQVWRAVFLPGIKFFFNGSNAKIGTPAECVGERKSC
jgi:hypothetical protein